jgi:Tfp pilus assembly protein PilX
MTDALHTAVLWLLVVMLAIALIALGSAWTLAVERRRIDASKGE